MSDDRLITLEDCARLASVKRTTSYQLRLRPDFPVPVFITATRKRYWRSEVVAWLESQRATGKEAAPTGR